MREQSKDIIETSKTMVAKRLAEVRKNSGYLKKEFAEKIGVAPSRYRHWETGVASPSVGMLAHIAGIAGVRVGYFFGEGESAPEGKTRFQTDDEHAEKVIAIANAVGIPLTACCSPAKRLPMPSKKPGVSLKFPIESLRQRLAQ